MGASIGGKGDIERRGETKLKTYQERLRQTTVVVWKGGGVTALNQSITVPEKESGKGDTRMRLLDDEGS